MKDIMLVSLIALAEAEEPMEIDITLVVGGFLVSGFIISHNKYVQHNQVINSINVALDQSLKDQAISGELPYNGPNFIHLRDAKYYIPGGNPIPGNAGVFVRIPLESVHGFSLGKLEALPA